MNNLTQNMLHLKIPNTDTLISLTTTTTTTKYNSTLSFILPSNGLPNKILKKLKYIYTKPDKRLESVLVHSTHFVFKLIHIK